MRFTGAAGYPQELINAKGIVQASFPKRKVPAAHVVFDQDLGDLSIGTWYDVPLSALTLNLETAREKSWSRVCEAAMYVETYTKTLAQTYEMVHARILWMAQEVRTIIDAKENATGEAVYDSFSTLEYRGHRIQATVANWPMNSEVHNISRGIYRLMEQKQAYIAHRAAFQEKYGTANEAEVARLEDMRERGRTK